MTHGIHPPGLAAMNVENSGEKYQPSNGTEGEFFIAAWCCKCARDKALREDGYIDECDDDERCDIMTRTMCFKVEDPEYPTEWQYGKDGQPCCTAFVPAGEAIPVPRCKYTVDMFYVDCVEVKP